MPLGMNELPSLALCFSASGTPHLESFTNPLDPSVVKVRIEGRSCKIEWDANAVTDAALAAALAHIKSLRFAGPLTVCFRFNDWIMEEQFADHNAAFQRIRETMVIQHDDVSHAGSPYKLKKAPFEEIASMQRPSEIERVCEEWSKSKGVLTSEFFGALDEIGILERAIIVDYDSKQQGLVFRFVGWGHGKHFGENWPVRAIGTPHDRGQPDETYTRWIAPHYDTAFEGEPRRDYIDSIIRTKEDAPSDRIQYERVLLPSRFVNGTPALVAISKFRPGLFPLQSKPLQDRGPKSGDPSKPEED